MHVPTPVRRTALLSLTLFAGVLAASTFAGEATIPAARAADEVEITLSIKDHKFDKPEVKVPAGKAVKLTVKNLDASAEEFESHALKVEKVISGKGSAVVRLKPLAKGSYPFVGEYHEVTAKGVLLAE
jgi:plastocyanin